MYGIQNGSNTIWLQLNAIILASKNRRKEPGHSGYFSPVLRKMYITLIFISETTINICLFFWHIVAFPMIQLYLKTVRYKARY